MGYYLLDHANRRARNRRFHGHEGPVRKTVMSAHTAEIAPSVSSAEAIGRYFATTDRQASYTSLFDSDGELRLLPSTAVAFGIVNFNSPCIHGSFATRAVYWGKDPGWDRAAVECGGEAYARWSHDHGIPVRRVTAGVARAAAAKGDPAAGGIVAHADMDPSRRTDPGAAFPWDALLAVARGQDPARTRAAVDGPRLLRLADPHLQGGDVLDWQHQLVGWFERVQPGANALPRYGADGDYGDETAAYTAEFQKRVGIAADGIVGPATRAAMAVQMRQPAPIPAAAPVLPEAKRYREVILWDPSVGAGDEATVRMLWDARRWAGSALYIARPDEHLHADLAIAVGGPTVRAIVDVRRYGRVHELVGEDRRGTWRAAAIHVAANPPA